MLWKAGLYFFPPGVKSPSLINRISQMNRAENDNYVGSFGSINNIIERNSIYDN